jgi:hypothetical protein
MIAHAAHNENSLGKLIPINNIFGKSSPAQTDGGAPAQTDGGALPAGYFTHSPLLVLERASLVCW